MPEPDTADPRPAWSRWVIYLGAALALLLVGATGGMMLTETFRDEPAATPQAGSVSVGFSQDMALHHEQAVSMANWARAHTDDPAIRQLAFDIGSTQLEQIGRMKGWLMLWGQPEQALGEYMTWMAGPDGHAHGHAAPEQASGDAPMPGMATSAEMEQMRSLSGAELDVKFLQLMLRHHQGGADMAEYARDHAAVPAVRTLAQSMLTSQGAEMDLMRRLLAERDAEPLPYP
nr:DUF305 domain-containing protein [Prauserella shujinwangii]